MPHHAKKGDDVFEKKYKNNLTTKTTFEHRFRKKGKIAIKCIFEKINWLLIKGTNDNQSLKKNCPKMPRSPLRALKTIHPDVGENQYYNHIEAM